MIRQFDGEDSGKILAQEIEYSYDSEKLTLVATSHPENALIVLIRGVEGEMKVVAMETAVEEAETKEELLREHKKKKEAQIEGEKWFYDKENKEMWISIPTTKMGALVNVFGIRNSQ